MDSMPWVGSEISRVILHSPSDHNVDSVIYILIIIDEYLLICILIYIYEYHLIFYFKKKLHNREKLVYYYTRIIEVIYIKIF
jgi:hypothetical protein